MKNIRQIVFLPLCLGAVAGCGHHHDDDVNIGRIKQGETRTIEVHAFAASPVRLEECDTATVVEVRGPNGSRQPLGENVDGEAHGVVSRNEHGECESDVDITALPDAEVGQYSMEVEFEYFVVDDSFTHRTSSFVDFRVVEADAPTRTPSPTPTATP